MATATIAKLRTQQNADAAALLSPLLNQPHYSKFDPDSWHVMQERDNDLIRSELMHGTASKAFVYSFNINGSTVTGISVVGARELASQYKGIKSRIVATVEKRGALFIFRSFNPLNIETRVLHELEADEDFYECVMEVSDIKTGNSIEVRKKESKTERRSQAKGGGLYDRPHYDVICESKAYRNGVLSVLPQSVIKDFQARCLAAGNTSNERTIQQLRASAAAHAAKHGMALDRSALSELTYDELTGLGAAAAQGLDHFKRSAMALGLIAGADQQTGELPQGNTQPPAVATPTPAPATQKTAPPPPSDDAGFGDVDPDPATTTQQAPQATQQAQQPQQRAGRRARAPMPAPE